MPDNTLQAGATWKVYSPWVWWLVGPCWPAAGSSGSRSTTVHAPSDAAAALAASAYNSTPAFASAVFASCTAACACPASGRGLNAASNSLNSASALSCSAGGMALIWATTSSGSKRFGASNSWDVFSWAGVIAGMPLREVSKQLD